MLSTKFCAINVVGILAVCFVGTLAAETVSVPLPNGHSLDVVDASQPQVTTAAKPDSPSVTGPNQVFSASGEGGEVAAGAANGKPVAVVEPGMRRLGRKMLGELELSGDGTSVQTTDLGVSGTASGHGVINGLDDAHIQPHGVEATTRVEDQETTAGVAVNPDCVGEVKAINEGPCVATTGK